MCVQTQIFEGRQARSGTQVARIHNMKHALLLIAATSILLAFSSAHAKSQTTFASEQSFQSCTESTVFACGMISPSGERYGTAHTRTMCSTYTFLPNGSVKLGGIPGFDDKGRYTIRAGVVFIESLDSKGKVSNKFKLALSKDGKLLGEMKLLPPKATQRD